MRRLWLVVAALGLGCAPALATQQICGGAEGNRGSDDPNATLNWRLTTRAGTTCVYAVNPPNDWINVGRHVVVRAGHGKVGFASDQNHFIYSPQSGFVGQDHFVIQFDRRVFTTGERAHRIISFTVEVEP